MVARMVELEVDTGNEAMKEAVGNPGEVQVQEQASTEGPKKWSNSLPPRQNQLRPASLPRVLVCHVSEV